MSRDDIIRMAREAGSVAFNSEYIDGLERFAALVAAAEREECAKLAGPHLDGAIAAAIRARSK
jgi:hypothetical protein